MDKIIGEVHLTDDFEKFEMMVGNRTDAESRSKKIYESVKQAGKYILAPIIVTDQDKKTKRFPISDGQARFTYCKKTGTPFTYYVVPGLTINDCIAMNASTSNWKYIDYIKSYASRGIESYVRTLKFIEESPYTISISLWALLNTDDNNKADNIKNGTIIVTQEMYDNAVDLVEFWKRFDDIETNRRKEFLIAIGYCYMLECVDNETLVRKIHQSPRDFTTIATVTDAIDVIEDSYNKRLREHVYIETEYFKFIDEKTGILGTVLKGKKKGGD